MKITALNDHKCYCCGSTIKRGEECFAFMIAPRDSEKSEFDVIYTCLKCLDEESCRVRIKERGGIVNKVKI